MNSSGKYISVSSDTEIRIEMDHNPNDCIVYCIFIDLICSGTGCLYIHKYKKSP